jgi:hypothetical protein
VTRGGLSAIVPNYLGVVPNPFAMLALVEAYDRLCQMQTEVEGIRQLAEQVRVRADESINESTELADAIRQMEEQYEAMAEAAGSVGLGEGGEDALPSTSELLRDVEDFLNRGNDAAK